MENNIYLRMTGMSTDEMLGRIKATVAYLNDYITEGAPGPADSMRNILDGAEDEDAYGRVCALIGYVIGEPYKASCQKLAYEMVTGEKLPGETKKA